MKLRLQENPKEWRKQALLAAIGLMVVSSILRLRHVLGQNVWLILMISLGLVMVCAGLLPRWFRGYYRFSMRLGFAISQVFGFVALVIFFIFILTPFGIILRLAGKDLLKLKPLAESKSFWQTAHEPNPLDRLF